MARSPRKQMGTRTSRIPLTDVHSNVTQPAEGFAPTTSPEGREAENWTHTRLSVHIEKTRTAVPLKEPGQSSAQADKPRERRRKAYAAISTGTTTNRSSGRGNTTEDGIRIQRKDDDNGPVTQERQSGRSSTHSVERQVPQEDQCIAKKGMSGTSPSSNGATAASFIQPMVTPTKGRARKALGTPSSSRVLRSHTKAVKFANLGSSQPKSDCMKDRAEIVDEVDEQGEDMEMGDPGFSTSIYESEGFSMVSMSSLPTMHEASIHPNISSPTAENTGGLARCESRQKQTPSIDPSPTIPPPPLPQANVRQNLVSSLSIPDQPSKQNKETPRMVRVVKAGMALRGVISPDSQHHGPVAPNGNADERIPSSMGKKDRISEVFEQSGAGTKRNFKGVIILRDKLSQTTMENADEAHTSTPRNGDDGPTEIQESFSKSLAWNKNDGYELTMPIDQPVTYPELPLQPSPQPGKVISSVNVDPSVDISSMRVASISRNTEDADMPNRKANDSSKLSITKELDSLLFPNSQSSTKEGEEQQRQTRETDARRRPAKKKGEDKDIWQLEAEVGRQPKRRAINTRKQVRVAGPNQDNQMREGMEDGCNVLPETSNTGNIRTREILQRVFSSPGKQIQVGSDFATKRQGDQFLEASCSPKRRTTLNSSIGGLEQSEDGDANGDAVFEKHRGESYRANLTVEGQPQAYMSEEEPIELSTTQEGTAATEVGTNTIQEPPATFSTEASERVNILPVKPMTQQLPNGVIKPKAPGRKAIIISPIGFMSPPYKLHPPRRPSPFINGRHKYYHHQHRYPRHYRPSLKIRHPHTGERIWTDGHYIHLKRLYKLTHPTTRAALFSPTPSTLKTSSTTSTSTTNRIKDSILSWLFPTSTSASASKKDETTILHKLISLPKPVNRAFYIHHAELETIKRFLKDVRRENRATDKDALWGEEYVAGRLLRLRVGEERRGVGSRGAR